MKFKLLISLSMIVLLSGCSTTRTHVVEPTDKPIVLKESYERVSKGLNNISFPPGVYEPDFRSDKGVYYRGPSKLANRAIGINQVLRGGLYIPLESDPDQRQGAWFDHQEGAGGLIAWAASSPKRTYRFKEPIPFEKQERQTP